MKLWSASELTVLRTFNMVDIVSAVAWSPDGLCIVAGVRNHPVAAVNAESGEVTPYSSHASAGSQPFVWGLACTTAAAPALSASLRFID